MNYNYYFLYGSISKDRRKHLLLNGIALNLEASLKVVNHSPTGFNWGYFGSGPSQLALAVLLQIMPQERALLMYRSFRDNAIALIPTGLSFQMDFTVSKYGFHGHCTTLGTDGLPLGQFRIWFPEETEESALTRNLFAPLEEEDA